eukprot:7136290-Prorocentrum_lima.AAC.1
MIWVRSAASSQLGGWLPGWRLLRGPPLQNAAPVANVLHGHFSSEVIISFEQAEGIVLSREQLECRNQFHSSPD